jgi:hypothetical protein
MKKHNILRVKQVLAWQILSVRPSHGIFISFIQLPEAGLFLYPFLRIIN